MTIVLFHDTVSAWSRFFAIKSNGVPFYGCQGAINNAWCRYIFFRAKIGHHVAMTSALSQRDDVVAGWCAGVKHGAPR